MTEPKIRTSIIIPESLLNRVKELAEKRQWSVNKYIINMITKSVCKKH